MPNTSAAVSHRRSVGTVAPGFEAVQNELDAMLLTDPGYSAQLTAYWKDEVVVDLVGGADLDADSVTGVFSCTKGAAAIVLATLVESGELDLDATVASYWPEFARHGKQAVTVRALFSHTAGLVNADGGLMLDEILDSRGGAAKLAEQMPHWRPGSAIGYHGITIGIFAEELVRRITGGSLQELYETQVRAPRDIDFYLGFPKEQEARFRPVLPVRPTPAEAAEIAASPTSPDGLTALAYNAIGSEFVPDRGPFSPNDRALRAAGPAAVGGIGSSRGLARLYAAVLGHVGAPLLSDDTVRAVSQQQVWGHDRVLNVDMSFAILFMKPQPRMEFGSYRAFGHDGAGGAIGFADPLHDLAFGYIPMPMSYPGGVDPKALRLSQIVRRSITGLA